MNKFTQALMLGIILSKEQEDREQELDDDEFQDKDDTFNDCDEIDLQ